MREAVAQLGKWAVDLLFPSRCVGCGSHGSLLCTACQASLPILMPPFCLTCAQPIPSGQTCRRCADSPLTIDGIRSPFLMEGIVRQMVYQLKYHNLRALAPVIGELLAAFIQDSALRADSLVPVPLNPRRERHRGYNQSALLAREIGLRAGLPSVGRALVRVKDSPPQASSASMEERARNVLDAFQVVDKAQVEGRSLLLIDDVCTTGSTLAACSLALKSSGAKSVWGLTIARGA